MKPLKALKLLNPLRQGEVGRPPTPAEQELSPEIALLRRWQSARLAHTHADLLADPRYRAASRFFLSDIYAPRDFSRRDESIEQIYRAMDDVLPHLMSETLAQIVALNELTRRLDRQLLEILTTELGMRDTLTAAQYTEAYRRSDAYEARKRQIELIAEVGANIEKLVELPFVGTALRLAKVPARLAGWADIHDFFARGFEAFQAMNGAEPFLETIRSRELALLERIFAGEQNPFGFSRRMNSASATPKT